MFTLKASKKFKPVMMPVKVVIAIAFFIILAPFNLLAQAPTISYASPQVYTATIAIPTLTPTSTGVAVYGFSNTPTSLGSGFHVPHGVAVDAAGNVYVADEGNNLVKKIPVGGGAPVTLGAGFSNPAGVALDGLGNYLYVADAGNNAIKKIPLAGGATITVSANGFNFPDAIALDRFDNIYVADDANNQVKMIAAGSSNATVIGSGFSGPSGVAVDNSGNVYVADESNNALKMIPAGGGAVVTVGTFTNPNGVMIDHNHNIFVVVGTANAIKEIPAGGGVQLTIGGSFNSPGGVATDASGNLYIADGNNNAVKKISPTGGYFLGDLLPSGLNFDNTTGKISGTPSVSSVARNIIITAYNSVGSGTATINIKVNPLPAPVVSYTSPQIYTAGTAITPLTPASTYVAAPAYNNTSVALAASFVNARNLATDAAGNLYVADGGANAVIELPAGGGAPITLGSGFSNPTGVAIDPAGNIYVADGGNSAVKIIPVGGGTPTIIASGITTLSDVAVDAAGNVYFSQSSAGTVKKIPAGGGTPVLIASGFIQAYSLAIDGSGNIYVADYGNNVVKKIPAGGGPVVPIGSGFVHPYAVDADAAGNVFVVDNAASSIIEIPANGGSVINQGTGLSAQSAVAVDRNGNLFISSSLKIRELSPAGGYYINPLLPPGLSFNSATGVISGTPAAQSASTSYTITAYNSTGKGTATLSITVKPFPPTISYSSPQTYYVATAIPPLSPTSTDVGSFAYNIALTNVSSGLNNPKGVATDAAGNIYYADAGNNVIKKTPAAGGAAVTVGTGFSGPAGIAVDAAGNIYVADAGNNVIKKIPAGGGTIVTIGTGFSSPSGVAVDAAGNVYVADTGHGLIKIIPAGGTPATITTTGLSLISPFGIAVDGAGHLYVTDYGTGGIYKLPVAGGSPVTILTGFTHPTNIGVDAAGNIYLSDQSKKYVSEIPVGANTDTSIGGGIFFAFLNPAGIAVDGAGNVYAADAGHGSIEKIIPTGGYHLNKPLPAGLSFNPATGVISGTPTGVSPATNYTVTVYNISGSASSTVNIHVALAQNANLNNLTVSGGATLSPVFAAATISYTASVSTATTSVQITPTLSDPNASVKVNGVAVASGAASASVPLNVGLNTIKIAVTAQDGITIKTYTITVKRISNNAYLSNLTLSSGALSPAFTNVNGVYTASVSNATASIAITPTAANNGATIKVNTAAVATGTASAAISLTVGPNNIIKVVVTAQDGVTTKTYTITVTRISNNAYLSNLVLSSGALSPAFTLTNGVYTATVTNSVASIKITPTVANSGATIKVNNVIVTSGTASAGIPLTVGSGNIIKAVVTAQDGVTNKTYTITVTRNIPGLNSFYLPNNDQPSPLILNLDAKVEANNLLSPNGDGINDIWVVKNIAFYPNNHVTVYDRAGSIVFTRKGYTNDWDGTYRGAVLTNGTYYYSVDLGNGSVTKGFVTVVSDK